ncbi:hypothetical protein [Trichoplusia ni ascovirus 2c]|uniref:hypothetical protein n=1 Tax=Trichoplusia ni ascovirus 2c TaxID=328615 RepID=UPI0000E441EF|nr:hypothetical protein TNAV2c_gp023 [Trichoplusia ni ascovirus 2c]ABF70540.1 hypothetical protein [Trichoplusia ni ascovirus 2c]
MALLTSVFTLVFIILPMLCIATLPRMPEPQVLTSSGILCQNNNCSPVRRKLDLWYTNVAGDDNYGDFCDKGDRNSCRTKNSCLNRLRRRIPCDFERGVFVVNFDTIIGTKCRSPCLWMKSLNSFTCYDDASNSLLQCIPPPDASVSLKILSDGPFETGQYMYDIGYVPCDVCRVKNLQELTTDIFNSQPGANIKPYAIIPQLSTVSDYITITDIIGYYERNFPTNHNAREDSGGSIISYTMYPYVNSTSDSETTIKSIKFLPLMVRAVITKNSLPNSHDVFEPTISTLADYRNMMPDMVDDYMSNLLPNRFNGPSEQYNIFPASSKVKNLWGTRVLDPLYRDMSRFFRYHPAGSINYAAVLTYDLKYSTRPTNFGISVAFFNKYGQITNNKGLRLSANTVNPFSNIYLNNTKLLCCVNERYLNRHNSDYNVYTGRLNI